MKRIKFSIIIPVRIETKYLQETKKALKKQSYKNFELIVITDKISKSPNPAIKRNMGAKISKGEYLAFLDDDSYPHRNWLKNALLQFETNPSLAAVCGPCLTPPQDNIYCQASGLVWSSYLGSGGAGTYRNQISSKRYVDDYPSVNLIVSKKSFLKINGFDTYHWPGEDTILCLNLVYKLNQKILYHPSIVVYHHRREIIINHLKQITRYALHRGNFARIFPKTSLKLGYLAPSLFVIYLISLIFLKYNYYFYPLYLYLSLLLYTLVLLVLNKNSIFTSFLAVITIPITHIYYGVLFMVGFFRRKLDFVPHKIDIAGKKYLGG